MRIVKHPLVDRDIDGVVDHILAITEGGFAAASRRLDEIDELLVAILDNPMSGVRLGTSVEGWLVRHGGRDQMLTVVLRPDVDIKIGYIALVGFGGRDWMSMIGDGASDTTS